MPSYIHWVRSAIGATLALSLSTCAYADVVPVVSSKSAVRALTKSELADIFLGRKLRFPDGQPAVALDQEIGSASRDEFYTAVVGISAVQLKAHWSKIIFTGRGKPPRAVSSDIEARGVVAANPQSVGYIDRALVDDSVRVLRIQPPTQL